jgi:hypothetical protein
MNDVLQQFYEDPTGENYVCALNELFRHDRPDADAFLLQQLAQLLAAERFVDLLDQLDFYAPALALSPQAHFLCAQAAEALQDEEELELRRFLLETCLVGILAQADGTQDSPYRVSWIEDQSLVLRARDQSVSIKRQTVEHQNRFIDVLENEHGKQVHFDVTCQVCCRNNN